MFIRQVDESLERMLRSTLPLPAEVGDVTFEAPTGSWSAQLSRLTVSLFLYDVRRSAQTARSAVTRTVDGVVQRREPEPIIELGYLVSAWAGSIRDEHQLLADVVNRVAAVETVPAEFAAPELNSSISLGFAVDDRNHLREIWSSAGGQLKASFSLRASVACDAFAWREQAPLVERIEALSAPMPRPADMRK